MSKEKPTAFDNIQLLGVHKEPTFGPSGNPMNQTEHGPSTCSDCGETYTLPELHKCDPTYKELQGELERLKGFARPIIRLYCWDMLEPDGCDIQALAEKMGLIVPHIATKEDVDDERDYGVGDKIYKFSDRLKEKP